MTNISMLGKRKKQQQKTKMIAKSIVLGSVLLIVVAVGYSSFAAQKLMHQSLASDTQTIAAAAAAVREKEAEVIQPDPPEDSVTSKIIVGLMVSNSPKYYDALEAQMDTWLPAIPQARKFVVAQDEPRKPPPHLQPLRFVKIPCPDREVWCKRIMHVVEAYRMLTEEHIDFEWLFSGNEDWYANAPLILDRLSKVDGRQKAVVYTGIGCSQHWKYHKNSQNNTKPRPAGFRDSDQQCQTLKERGGVCAGNGIFFSRRAIEILGQGGQEATFNRTLSQPFNYKSHPQGDPVLSCLIYSFNDQVSLEYSPLPVKQHKQMQDYCESEWKRKKMCELATVHAVKHDGMTPADIIRDSHKLLTKVP